MSESASRTSAEQQWFATAMPLGEFLEADDCPTPLALADAVGDRYLCRHNPVFAAVRKAAVGFGYRFSSEDTPSWRDYMAMPLTTLHRILDEKTIPYLNTAETFRRLREINPDASLSPGFLLAILRRNYAFHESAHCVAHAVLSGMRPCADLRDKETSVLDAFLEEAFANTVETLGTLSRTNAGWDRFFYCLNSFMSPKEKTTAILEQARVELGESLRFTLLFLSSFEANLTRGEPDDAVFDRIETAADCAGGGDGIARKVIGIGFNLNKVFREYTAPAYFEFLRCKGEYTALMGAAWLADKDNRSFARQLSGILFEKAVSTAAVAPAVQL